jgi:peptide/nickel transport system permease protein
MDRPDRPRHRPRSATRCRSSGSVCWALLLFYAKLGWVAGPGRLSVSPIEDFVTPVTGLVMLDAAMQRRVGRGLSTLFWHIILPGLAARLFLGRLYQPHDPVSFMLNELQQEYVVAARAKGLSEARIIWAMRYATPSVPLVTVIALSYAGLLEGSVLTETIFAWPGLGLYITNSLQNADMNAVLGGTVVIGAVFVGINLSLRPPLPDCSIPRTRSR